MLFRINALSEAFEDALTARVIGYVIRGAARFFDRQEVRQAITLLRGTARSGGGGDEAPQGLVVPLLGEVDLGRLAGDPGAGRRRLPIEVLLEVVERAK